MDRPLPLAERMKVYESATRAVLPARTWTVVRVDGRAFGNYTRGCERPFDARFMADMDLVAEALCKEISGAAFAYTQSDEVSVLYTDLGSTRAEPWFGGVLAKQISIAASVATAVLNDNRPGPRRAQFDARVFTLPDPAEVANYFLWRQRDATRNSIAMAGRAHFSHRRLLGVNTGTIRELLAEEHGVAWENYPAGARHGRLTVRRTGPRDVTWVDNRTGEQYRDTALRSWWETAPAPEFTAGPDGCPTTLIPTHREAP